MFDSFIYFEGGHIFHSWCVDEWHRVAQCPAHFCPVRCHERRRVPDDPLAPVPDPANGGNDGEVIRPEEAQESFL